MTFSASDASGTSCCAGDSKSWAPPVDAHARLAVAGREFKAPSYREAIGSVHTYVLTPRPLQRKLEPNRKEVYVAYRNGRLYMVYPRVAAAPEFEFIAQEGKREAVKGQSIPLEQRVR